MSGGPELTQVEEPFLNQLAGMGWKTVTGNFDFPSATGRQSFREVFIQADLEQALRRINLRDGKQWLDDARVAQAIGALERISPPRLMEANQEATQLLLEAKGSIRPDITLFVNGIPLVVVECKSPVCSEPMAEAVDQLRRYHNARKVAGEVEENEGNERLFYTNQFLVATSYDEARVGTLGAELSHYLEWKDTAPVPLDQVKAELGTELLSSQHKLVAGMLRPAHLLDTVRHFVILSRSSGASSRSSAATSSSGRCSTPSSGFARGRRAPRTASTIGAAASSGTRRGRERA